MPFDSEKQRRYLWSQKPKVARQIADHAKMRVTEGMIAFATKMLRPDEFRSFMRNLGAQGYALTPGALQAAMAYEKTHGSGSARDKAGKVANHLQERPDYYVELEAMLEVPMAKAGGWERGPRGGMRRRVGSGWEYKDSGGGDSSSSRSSGGSLPSPDAVKKQGQTVVEHVRKKNPALAQSMEQTLGKLDRAMRSQHGSGGGRDDEVTSQVKAFGRAFNQAAAPASILGPELAGLLREVGEEQAQGQQAAKPKDALKNKPKGEEETKKAGPYADGSWGPVPTIAPIGGSAPRAETPPLPDYQEIYYQPKSKQTRKREAEIRETRRAGDSRRASAVFGFHGDPTRGEGERKLHYIRGGASEEAPREPAKRFGGSAEDPGADLVADIYGRRIAEHKRDDEDDEDEEEKTEKALFLLQADQVVLEALYKAGGHKYVRRVPYTDSKGRKRYRYYYSESSLARDVQEGEKLRLGKKFVTVSKVDEDGTVHLAYPDGSTHRVPSDDWGGFMARFYGPRYQAWAEKRARQSIDAVTRLVPRALLGELKGSTDAERLEDLKQRAPKVYERLQKSFQRAGINPFRAKRVIRRTLERRGWEPDARAAAIGSVLTKRVGPDRIKEVMRGAENLAAGGRVEAKHLGAVVELTDGLGGKGTDATKRIESIAKKAEAELQRVQKALDEALTAGAHEKAEAYAEVLASSAVQKLVMLSQAFPGLGDRAIQPARELLMEVPSLAPHPKPKTEGAEAALFVAGEGGAPKALKARYRLMEAGEVKASHDPTKGFKKRDDYPEDVQERAYHRDKAEQAKVIRQAQKLQPAFVINTNPDAVNGPPMITPKGEALGGNSRAMSIQKAYADHPEKAEEMRAYLMAHAHEFGLSPDDVAAMKQPMLVREVIPEEGEAHTKEEMRLLVRQMNESFTQGMDPRTMQVAMGRKLSDDSMKILAEGMQEDDTLRKFLGTKRADRFIDNLMKQGIIDQRNANQYFKKGTRQLNEDGKQLVERILVGRVVGDADTLSSVRARPAASIAQSVPYMVQATAYGEGYDIGPDLAVAVSALNDLQHKVDAGVEPSLASDMSEQRFNSLFNHFDSLFGDKHPVVDNPKARALLEVLIRKPGPRQMSGVFKEFARRAAQNPEGQSTMFGPAPTPTEVLLETVRAAL